MSAADAQLQQTINVLYVDHHSWLFGWLRNRLGCAEQAADLAHDTFTRLLIAKETPELREPRAFLTTVARGLLSNWYQRKSLEQAYLDALSILPEAESPSPEQRYILFETLHELDAMLDTLKPKVRQAFLLSQIEGLKYEEIAHRIDVSLPTVKRYMQQAFSRCLALMD